MKNISERLFSIALGCFMGAAAGFLLLLLLTIAFTTYSEFCLGRYSDSVKGITRLKGTSFQWVCRPFEKDEP